MPLRGYSDYSDVSWFVRAMRAVPVIAGAALVGGIIGGFAVFAVDSALNWEPASQARPKAGADQQPPAQSSAAEQPAKKPVRVVGGAILDPSAGMSGPPPAPQQQRSFAPAQPQIPSSLLAPKPLGPRGQLDSPTATARTATQTQDQAVNQTAGQTAVQTQSAAQPQTSPPPATPSRAQPNPNQQQSVASPSAAPTGGADKTGETARNEAKSNRALTANDQDRAASLRQSQRQRHATFGANPWRNGDDDASVPPSRRRDARSYDRLYDSYGNRRNSRYGTGREQPRGDAYEPPPQPRPEPYWGGGFFRRGYDSEDD